MVGLLAVVRVDQMAAPTVVVKAAQLVDAMAALLVDQLAV